MISTAQLVRAARRELGAITQDELAKKLAVSPGSVKNWEQGLFKPHAKSLRALKKLVPSLKGPIEEALGSGLRGAAKRQPDPILEEFKEAIAAHAERLGIDFESALRETLAAGITSLTSQSTEQRKAAARRQAASGRRAQEHAKSGDEESPIPKTEGR